ncbi:MAG TPA: antitoxin [Ilumatobacteraceae bacterium]
MGLFDKVKGLVRGNKKQIESGIDKGADMVTDKVGTEHADKVEKGADMAKDAVEKLAD